MVSPELFFLIYLFYLVHFVEKEKHGKLFGSRSSEYGGWGIIDVSLIDKCKTFNKILMHVAAFESISLYWVSDCGLKTQIE